MNEDQFWYLAFILFWCFSFLHYILWKYILIPFYVKVRQLWNPQFTRKDR